MSVWSEIQTKLYAIWTGGLPKQDKIGLLATVGNDGESRIIALVVPLETPVMTHDLPQICTTAQVTIDGLMIGDGFLSEIGTHPIFSVDRPTAMRLVAMEKART